MTLVDAIKHGGELSMVSMGDACSMFRLAKRADSGLFLPPFRPVLYIPICPRNSVLVVSGCETGNFAVGANGSQTGRQAEEPETDHRPG